MSVLVKIMHGPSIGTASAGLSTSHSSKENITTKYSVPVSTAATTCSVLDTNLLPREAAVSDNGIVST